MIEIIAFDADDTLWHNETAYLEASEKFERLLAKHYGVSGIEGEIYVTEKINLQYFGYGIKSFTISMIETAVRLTNGRVEGRHIQAILGFAREMLEKEVVLLDDAEETISTLAMEYPLMLITKGDQFEQERKVERSGLAPYFKTVEIVSDKTAEIYSVLLKRHEIDPAGFVMIGNSLRSDILPVTSLGGQAIYIPYDLTWEHETILEEPMGAGQYHQLERLDQLPVLVRKLDV
jgi:putative hydrolase of the HAD superfamily